MTTSGDRAINQRSDEAVATAAAAAAATKQTQQQAAAAAPAAAAPATATSAPACASRMANALPIPRLAPVTTATRPCRSGCSTDFDSPILYTNAGSACATEAFRAFFGRDALTNS